MTVKKYKNMNFASAFDLPRAERGIEPYATWYKLADDAVIPRFHSTKNLAIVVTGGETQAFFQYGGMRHSVSVSIDKWR